MKKSFICCLVLTILFSFFSITALAQSDVGLIISEKEVVTDQMPIIEDGVTFVPLRLVSECLGCEVIWNPSDSSVKVIKEQESFTMYIGMDYVITSSGPVKIPKAPKLINSRTMVPLRAVAELLSCKVDWLDSTYSVYIDSPQTLKKHSESHGSKQYADKDLVYDAYVLEDVRENKYGETIRYSYKIPAFNMVSSDALNVNRSIYDKYYGEIQNSLQTLEQDGFLSVNKISNEYYVNMDIISVCITSEFYDWGGSEREVYNMNCSTGKALTNSELIAFAGYSESGFISKLKQAAGDYYVNLYENNCPDYMLDYYNDRYNYTISDEACNMSTPIFIGENGNIFAVASIGSIAGASKYEHIVDTGINVNPYAPTFTMGRALECIEIWERTQSLSMLFTTHENDTIEVQIAPQYSETAKRVMEVDSKAEVINYILQYITSECESKNRITETAFEMGGVEHDGKLYAYMPGFGPAWFIVSSAKQIEDLNGRKAVSIKEGHNEDEYIFCFEKENGRWKIAEIYNSALN